MLDFRTALCVLLILAALSRTSSGNGVVSVRNRGLFSASRGVVKQTMNVGATTVSKGLSLGNSAVQKASARVTEGVEKGTLAGKVVVGTGTAVAGHALAVGSNFAVNTTGKVDSAVQGIPILGFVVKTGNDKVRQTFSLMNKVGQAVLNGVDAVNDASISLAKKVTQIGTGAVSKSSKLGTALSQATVAVGNSLALTGVDTAYLLGKSVADQVTSGNFNISALTNNITVGSKSILSENSKLALSNILPALNATFSGSSKTKKNSK